jgi:hypothetical protein
VRQQELVVGELLAQYASFSQVYARLREPPFGLSLKRTRMLIDRVYEQWDKQHQQDLGHARNKAIRSVRRSLTQVESKMKAEEVSALEWIRLQRLKVALVDQLMDLEGTRAPIQVDVNVHATVNHNLVAVMASMDEQQTAALIAKADEDARLAQGVRAEAGSVVDMPSHHEGTAE